MSEVNETVEQEANVLTLNDLNAIRAIIDLASTRGAFKTNEMVAVGQTYNKLDAFLNQAIAAQQNKEQDEGTE